MTWIVQTEHPSEAAAEAHAVELIRSNTARTATYFELAPEGDSNG